MIAICLPSRGLIHSRTIQCIIENTRGKDVEWFISHDLPIPDCFNDITNRALDEGAEYLWFVEEDMKFPPDTLDRLLEANADVATIDYPVGKTNVVELPNKFGTGCTLVKSEVFESIKEWRSDIVYSVPEYTSKQIKKTTYGKHDIHFAQECKKHGFEVKVVGIGTQYRVKKYGEERTNNGFHEVTTL